MEIPPDDPLVGMTWGCSISRNNMELDACSGLSFEDEKTGMDEKTSQKLLVCYHLLSPLCLKTSIFLPLQYGFVSFTNLQPNS